jgi:hypothetical protein
MNGEKCDDQDPQVSKRMHSIVLGIRWVLVEAKELEGSLCRHEWRSSMA